MRNAVISCPAFLGEKAQEGKKDQWKSRVVLNSVL